MRPLTKKLLADFQIRKTKQQKASFRAWLCDELGRAGYAPQVETGGLLNSSNVVAGDPEKAQVLLAAHYDTCAVLPFPNFITPRNFLVYLLFQLLICALFLLIAIATEVAVLLAFDPPLWGALLAIYAVLGFCIWWMLAGKANKHTANDNTSGVAALLETALALPEELRGKVCFVFFDNEEKGLLGSAAFAGRHPAAKREALVLNFDCVGDGDFLQFFPRKAVKGEEETLRRLEVAFTGRGEKTVEIVRSFGFYPSDQAVFRRGVGVCALKKKPLIGYYMGRIHTNRDTVLEEENVLLLRDGVVRLLRDL